MQDNAISNNTKKDTKIKVFKGKQCRLGSSRLHHYQTVDRSVEVASSRFRSSHDLNAVELALLSSH